MCRYRWEKVQYFSRAVNDQDRTRNMAGSHMLPIHAYYIIHV